MLRTQPVVGCIDDKVNTAAAAKKTMTDERGTISMKLGVREVLFTGALSILIGCEPIEDAANTTTTETGGANNAETNDDNTSVTEVLEPVLAIGAGVGSAFQNGVITLGASGQLSAGGTTSVSVNIVDINASNEANKVPTSVVFSSVCEAEGKATFSNKVIPATNIATTTYTAQGCFGEDYITATLGDKIAFATVTVAPAEVNSLSFSAEGFLPSISYRNTAMLDSPNNTPVSFVVLDDIGQPIPGQTVSFSIYSADASHGTSLSVNQAESNADGVVTTVLTSGYLATNVRVTATYENGGDTIATQSQPIAVNTGYADADSFLLTTEDAVVKYAGQNSDATTSITVSLADKHNNPVVDGTVVQFWAEYGSINPTCVTVGSVCSVVWTSSGVYPADRLATIVAYTVGVDSFQERGENALNAEVAADGLFSVGDAIAAHSEVFFDRNYNGNFDASTESFIDHNGNGEFDSVPGNNLDRVYRGVDCDAAARAADHCVEESALLWGRLQLVYSTYQPLIAVNLGPYQAGDTLSVEVTDVNGNYPPAGTTLSLVALGDTEAELRSYDVVTSVRSAGQSSFTFEVDVLSVTTGGSYELVVQFPEPGLKASAVVQLNAPVPPAP